jgi:hypothetical protein
MSHTYFVEEGLWLARGTYVGEDGARVPLEGEARVVHRGGKWVCEGAMRLLVPGGPEFAHRYEVEPFAEGSDLTAWKSFNAAIGALSGTLARVDDALLSTYAADAGGYAGVEVLLQRAPDLYENRGVLTRDGARVSSWSVQLRRVE